MTEDDTVPCELCGSRHFIGDMTPTDDGCDLCPACAARARAEFEACAHAWLPGTDQWGEPAHTCERCSHIVCDADFPALFGRPAPAREERV